MDFDKLNTSRIGACKRSLPFEHHVTRELKRVKDCAQEEQVAAPVVTAPLSSRLKRPLEDCEIVTEKEICAAGGAAVNFSPANSEGGSRSASALGDRTRVLQSSDLENSIAILSGALRWRSPVKPYKMPRLHGPRLPTAVRGIVDVGIETGNHDDQPGRHSQHPNHQNQNASTDATGCTAELAQCHQQQAQQQPGVASVNPVGQHPQGPSGGHTQPTGAVPVAQQQQQQQHEWGRLFSALSLGGPAHSCLRSDPVWAAATSNREGRGGVSSSATSRGYISGGQGVEQPKARCAPVGSNNCRGSSGSSQATPVICDGSNTCMAPYPNQPIGSVMVGTSPCGDAQGPLPGPALMGADLTSLAIGPPPLTASPSGSAVSGTPYSVVPISPWHQSEPGMGSEAVVGMSLVKAVAEPGPVMPGLASGSQLERYTGRAVSGSVAARCGGFLAQEALGSRAARRQASRRMGRLSGRTRGPGKREAEWGRLGLIHTGSAATFPGAVGRTRRARRRGVEQHRRRVRRRAHTRSVASAGPRLLVVLQRRRHQMAAGNAPFHARMSNAEVNDHVDACVRVLSSDM
ncbi:hypothetical protein VOLCADRAFT_104660 [Volvox carteri f. nagariensis]|uniref:Uncharacterized protein n=1 Tax=Volvox carteri f. nagariensis TaxID=3068 RepID=D8TVM3_VOLCA|nr:uncharacterized protein VOLCADRAFT_104660 [Volvox carteri f. nagariensis]EFJ48608.1 hypothetical protein VOLCADRAFT_104660 [Volvox carteri f. nagariensis]|eukprot:XP_002950407.1 hypothetical protein VOLCADRAFT_104660 [Volvox carteri f. nagariensis]